MAKTIVFCADGTWNGPEKPAGDETSVAVTNDYKLFSNLDGVDDPVTPGPEKEQEQERVLRTGGVISQIAKYLHGVGDSNNPIVKLIGGATGAGLIERIIRGYTFLSRNYQAGDKIFVTGFSRGAYTVRALSALIAAKGLMDASRIDLSDKEQAYKYGLAVWYAYRRDHHPSGIVGFPEAAWDRVRHLFDRGPAAGQMISASIEAVGVWDTVGALGIPSFNLAGERLDEFQFADRRLSPIVQHGFHAIAVDEERADFGPTLWEDDPRATQVLFPGAHADVGGGYPMTGHESGLSDCTLFWMQGQLRGLGVRFAGTPKFVPAPESTGPAHQPWRGTVLLCKHRQFTPGLHLSQTLMQRLNAGPVVPDPGQPAAKYQPGNLTGYLAFNGPVAGPAGGIAIV